ncbi:hypothetical protein ACOXXX_18375 [Thalassococcus sp. BH17M4-6]|uniref:hypothetical protein n=1 Tax=Thalassococcus sp. BH17M4-6 TaxID=3413148 RepID=UPI003BD75C6A
MTTAPRLAAAALCLASAAAALCQASAAAAQEQSITTGLDVSDSDAGSADLFVGDATSLSGFVCVGFECTDSYVFGNAFVPPLVIQDTAPGIEMRRTGVTDEIWSIGTDTADRFIIVDVDENRSAFAINNGAPADALVIAGTTGHVGLGVFSPQASLHIREEGAAPTIRFEEAGSSSGTWNLAGTASRFILIDPDSGATPFDIERDAPSNALFIEATTGDVGLGTGLPETDLHILSNDTPGITLEQISGTFGNKKWELNGNEISFAIRDADAGTLPLLVDSGAPDNSLAIDDDGSVGLGTSGPAAPLHVRRTNGTAEILVENTAGPSAPRGMFTMRSNGGSFFTLDNTDAGTTWFFTHENAAPNRFIIADAVADGPEMSLSADGVLTVPGGFVVGSTTLNVPDYVFADDYNLRPLSEVQTFIADNKHLPDIPSAAEVAEDGLDMTDMQMRLLKKVEELTLYTLAQEAELTRLRALEARLEVLEAR